MHYCTRIPSTSMPLRVLIIYDTHSIEESVWRRKHGSTVVLPLRTAKFSTNTFTFKSTEDSRPCLCFANDSAETLLSRLVTYQTHGTAWHCHVPDTRSCLWHCDALFYMPHMHVELFVSTFMSLCVPDDSVDSNTRRGTVWRPREACLCFTRDQNYHRHGHEARKGMVDGIT